MLLYFREGRSTQQVAQLLGLSDAAVRKRLQRARDDLRGGAGLVAGLSAAGLI